MKQPSWHTKAKTVFGNKAMFNIGDGSDGQFAVVTPCRDQVDYSLWATREAAEKMKVRLNRAGCCGGCWPKTHYVLDLADGRRVMVKASEPGKE